jgi:serine/threonine-protein kinase
MNRRVAVKELAVPGGSTTQQKDERLKRFLREAKAAGSLAHPNIVTIYEVGQEGERHYLVMEYLDGQTLRNELDKQGFLPTDRAIEIAEAILRGLEYAHQNGVIHRDIKPENIQILSDGRVKLTDFGIARLTFEPNLTMDGQVFGTPSYMSPEQVVGKDIDVRSDLFSVGVVLYEMVAGQKPFQGDSVVSITYAIMNKNPDQPQQANYALWQLISKALDKSPALRYSGAPDMLKALENARHQPTATNLGTTSMGAPPIISPAGNPFLGGTGLPNFPGMQPPPQQIPQVPINYPYNPYQGAPPAAPVPVPPMGGISQQPYNPLAPPTSVPQVPLSNVPMQVYYPPPPRRPLLKPDQRALIGRIILVVLFMGTLLGGVAAALIYWFGR